MEIKARFDHYNINVFDLGKSIQFYKNTEMGLYFIIDPDGYWIEVLPLNK
jgi:lactoylglutathione lyase